MPKYTVDTDDAGVELTEDQAAILRKFGHVVAIKNAGRLVLAEDHRTLLVEPSIANDGGVFVQLTNERSKSMHLTEEQTTQLRDHLSKLLEGREPKLRTLKDAEGDIAYEVTPDKFYYADSRAEAEELYADSESGYSVVALCAKWGPLTVIEAS